MSLPDIYLLCFAVGTLWALAALLLGASHFGHSAGGGHGHVHVHSGHAPTGHAHPYGHGIAHKSVTHDPGWVGSMLNPSCAAMFLAWFGGIGYLLTRHSGFGFWIDLVIALAVGLTGAIGIAGFVRFLQSREQPLDAADYDMVGVLGHVSSTIRPGGIGEVIYVRDGARKPVAARSEDDTQIARGEEVIVTRYEKGIAYVRTWDALTEASKS